MFALCVLACEECISHEDSIYSVVVSNFSCPVCCSHHHISQIFNCIWNNLDYWPRKDTRRVRSCVCVCKSMTVNGRNPSTNPHLSSWITDIINRRDSSISPVFPIQRWGAGLFPSLSADLMTFTKLLYICVQTTCTRAAICLRRRVYFCACLSNLADRFVLNGLCWFLRGLGSSFLLPLSVLAAMQLHNRPPRGSAAAEELPEEKMK